jgi:hypothetical protein
MHMMLCSSFSDSNTMDVTCLLGVHVNFMSRMASHAAISYKCLEPRSKNEIPLNYVMKIWGKRCKRYVFL